MLILLFHCRYLSYGVCDLNFDFVSLLSFYLISHIKCFRFSCTSSWVASLTAAVANTNFNEMNWSVRECPLLNTCICGIFDWINTIWPDNMLCIRKPTIRQRRQRLRWPRHRQTKCYSRFALLLLLYLLMFRSGVALMPSTHVSLVAFLCAGARAHTLCTAYWALPSAPPTSTNARALV